MISETNITVDGNYPSDDGTSVRGGLQTWIASGNFGGGTLTLQAKYPGITDWVQADDGDNAAVMSVAGVKNLTMNSGVMYRLQLVGSSGAAIAVGVI